MGLDCSVSAGSMGETGAALRAAAGQNLAAVCGGHALPKAVLLGALTLLGLIGTNHCLYTSCTVVAAMPPVHNSEKRCGFHKTAPFFGVTDIIPYRY